MSQEDRRGAYRRNAFTFGALLSEGGEVGCLVWDLSETGALIEFDEPLDLTGPIRLRLAPGTPPREAEVAWCKGHRVGIAFRP
jgi:hypothetical protein